jgi:3-hydroxybutyryl-CoA dehydrogenase
MSEFKTIGVVGAGTMGSGIAQLAATFGHEVVLYDTNEQGLEKAIIQLKSTLNRLVEKGKITDSDAEVIFDRIKPAGHIEDFNSCDLVIEAIIENLDIKQKLFKQLESVTRVDCVLATNTSSLSVTSIAGGCAHPERAIGIHFFNPAPLMPLVEVIPALQTDVDLAAKIRLLLEGWKKVVVLAKDTPGFIVNRVARPFYGESIRIYEEGIADMATIDWALKTIGGFKMGPFELMDYIGNDINYTVTETVFKEFFYDPRYKPSFTQKRVVEAGRLGRKTGRGYYDYSEGASQPQPTTDEVLGKMIVNRVLAMLINEAADALYLNISSNVDIDLAMTKGVNYPKGLLAWADEIGVKTVFESLEKLHNEYGEDRYRPSLLLRKMATENRTFY